jgi:hypothetical protein
MVCAGLPGWWGDEGRAQSVVDTGTGTSAGFAVSATADFTVTAGQIVLTLENTTVHTDDAGQLLTGIKFTLDPSVAGATLTAATAEARNIADNGSYVDGPTVSLLNTWESTLSNKGVYQIDFNPNAEYAIVGPADGETATLAGMYNANGSIEGNSGHNPYTAISASFTLSSSDITADTAISGVTFIYGTQLNTFVPGQPTQQMQMVPEMSTAAFGIAMLGVLSVARRRIASAKTQNS